MDYKSFDCSPSIIEPSLKPFFERPSFTPLPDTHLITVETVDKILEDKIITTKIGGTHRYLNRCKRKTPTVDSQLDRGDLLRIVQCSMGDLIQLTRRSLGFSHPGRMMQTSTQNERAEEQNPRSPSSSWKSSIVLNIFLFFLFFSFFI